MRSLFFLIPIIFTGALARADQSPPVFGPPKDDHVPMEQTAEAISEGVQKQIAKAADLLDVELAGQRYVTGRNPTHINLEDLEIYEDGRKLRSSVDFGLNLRLPNTEKRWALRFSSYDEDAEERNLNQKTVRTTPRPTNYGTSLVLFKKLGNIKTSFQPRIQLSNPLYSNYTLRLESEAKLKIFRLSPMVEFFADSQKGTGEYVTLETGYRPHAGKLEFVLTNDEQYQQNMNYFNVDHGLSVNYQLTDARAVSTAAIFTFENHAYHLASMTYSVSVAEQVYPKILRVILSPYWLFAKGYAFKGHTGVSLNTEIVF